MRKISAKGRCYIEAGDGPPLVFVHGSLLDYRYWAREVTHFSNNFRCIAFSRRHHWPRSPAGAFSYTSNDQTNDVIDFIEQSNCGAVHLVGHSYAGYLAILMACRRPDLLLSLTLVEPGGPVEGQAPGINRSDDLIKAADMISMGDIEAGVSHFMNCVCAGRSWADGAEAYQLMTLQNATTLAEQVKEVRPVITAAELSRISAPVMLMQGEISHSPFPETIASLSDKIPNSKVVVVPQASHLVNVDNHSIFCHELEGFLNDQL